jgi:outer membrane protein TolC
VRRYRRRPAGPGPRQPPRRRTDRLRDRRRPRPRIHALRRERRRDHAQAPPHRRHRPRARGRRRARLEQVLAGYLPRISFAADYRWERGGGAGTQKPTGDTVGHTNILQTTGGSVAISQLLFDFGKTDASAARAFSNFVAAQADLASAENEAVFGFKQAFFDVLKQEELVRVGEETVRQFEKRLEQVKGFVDAGSRQKYDLTKAQVDLGTAQLTLVKARTALVVAKALLNTSLGLASDPAYALDKPGAAGTWTLPFDDAVESARLYHPRLQSFLLRENAARAAIDAAIADFYPQITLQASFSWSGALTPMNWFSFLGPALNWLVFSGWDKTGALHGAVAALREAYASRARRSSSSSSTSARATRRSRTRARASASPRSP